MTLYKIDEVASACNLTKRTIRYYEEIGLLSPQRSEGNTRLYTQHDIDRLKKIISARDVLGFSLQELHGYIEIVEVLKGQRERYRNITDLEERRQQLEQIDNTLGKQLDMMESKIRTIYSFKAEAEQLRQQVRDGMERLGREAAAHREL
ncbi:MerR family transcriptional regulator [Paenibacillus campi]|uniref:MerR family transcriptional regulator n=1 Tax=Paenibacillus campi TaxID=3106031 RepID=UPI002AFFB6B2|nr:MULTISPECIES: MerR family transcriptional regulator [unclassified Paenibacillus]